MKKRNIYQNRSQELLSLFEDAGSSAKVMCVPMDFAKNLSIYLNETDISMWLAFYHYHDMKILFSRNSKRKI